jgi:LPXTG-site transpeptidase (sortase) family protein
MRAFAFAVTFIFFFGLTYVFLGLVDALPNPPDSASTQAPAETDKPETVAQGTQELPVRVVVRDAGIDSKVVNPTSTDLDALNAAVDEAAMRWPTSGLLGTDGTVALFGHSSHLPIVHNQVYKTFNGIENLKKGAVISVYSGTAEYRYGVTGVRLASATEDVVELPSDGKHLVLVTCDNFGSHSDRYVVTADFEGAYAL